MSVEVLISPRISFSHDVDVDIDVAEDDPSIPGKPFPFSSSPSPIDAGFDFDFAFSVDRQGALVRESSTADELFSDGKLLPISINFATNTEITDAQEPDSNQIQSFQDYSPSPIFPCFETEQGKKEDKIIKSLKDYLDDSTDFEDEDEDEGSDAESPQPQATEGRTFWKFSRSSSLNISNFARNRGKQSIPSKLNPLPRSKSTGGSLSRKPIEEDEEETKAGLPSVAEARRSFWKFKRSNSLDCDKSCQNRGGLIGSLKVILLRSNSTGEVLARKTGEEARQFRIRRSSSLNCDGENRSRGSVMGSPTPLGRSHSTGSAYNSKQIGELQMQCSARSSSTSSSCIAKTGAWRKGQGRSSFKDYYANFYRGERVNPVLNLPSPYISRVSVDLLGFGSLFCNGRHKKKRK